MSNTPTPGELLLTAVQRLTQPHYDVVTIDESLAGKTTARLKRDGLLKQLRLAIVGGIGAHEGSTPGRERIPFDTGALELYESIERDITNRWVTVTGRPTFLELETTLTNWYLVTADRHAKGEFTSEQMERILSMVEGWGRKIEGHFDKPRVLELTVLHRQPGGEVRRIPAECPSCHESYAFHPVTGDRVFALMLTYRETGANTMQTVEATCRFCGTSWAGGGGARELSYSIEQFEKSINEVN
jgi:hypothetical protein